MIPKNKEFWQTTIIMYRQAKGISQRAFAKQCGCSPTTIYKLENKKIDKIRDLTVGKLCIAIYGSIEEAKKQISSNYFA